jgi:adenine-specific DNA-methyltransferase
VYAKEITKVQIEKKQKCNDEKDRLYKLTDEFVNQRGRYYITQLNKNSLQYSDGLNYPITGPDGIDIWPGGGFEDKVWIWRWSKEKVEWGSRNGFIVFKKTTEGKYKVYTKSYEYVDNDGNFIVRNNPYSSLEFITKEYANFNATPELEKIFDGRKVFSFPKSVLFIVEILKMINTKSTLILDFFAGSGTTAHAVINLNREDGGNRKYILVEMGDHFNTVLKPRIEKVVYSPDWKDGKPTSFDKGVSHCFKYMRLESYEDTLNNLELPETDPIASNPEMQPALREDYMLHYLLDTEANASLLDIDMFKNPFGGYRLKIKRPGSEACDETPVDLIETFNYLTGLRVTQYYLPRRYSARFKRAVDPELPGEEGSRRLVLDGRPKLDDAGKWSFLRLEGVVPAHPLNPNNGQTKRVLVIWRNLTGDMEQDNAVLDWFADDLRLNDKVPEYDIVYVNGCNNLGADRKETDSYQVRLIEEEFFRKMWG